MMTRGARIGHWRRDNARAAAILTVLVLASSPAAADVTLLSHFREISTFGVLDLEGAEHDTFDVNALQFELDGPFDDMRETVLEAAGASIASDARQLSLVTTSAIAFEGGFSSAGNLPAPAGFVEGFGVSSGSVRFTTDAGVVVRLTGSIDASGNGLTHFELRDAGGAALFERGVQRSSAAFDEVVNLPPGEFTLRVNTGDYGRADANGATPSAGSFSVAADFGSTVDAGIHVAAEDISVTPNPTSTVTMIRFGPAVSRDAVVVVHDVAGRRVRELGLAARGPVRWDTRDDSGRRVSAGVYLVTAGPGVVRRLVVTR